MAIAMDESVRDNLVQNSQYFARFVINSQFNSICRIWKNRSISNEKEDAREMEGFTLKLFNSCKQ